MSLLAIDWTMDPAIFRTPFEVRYYGLFWALAFVFGYQIVQKSFKAEKLDDKKMDKLLFYGLIASVVGARLGHVFFYGPYWGPEGYLSNPVEILMIRNGGLASHGGAIGMAVGLWLYKRFVLKERSYLWILDRVAVATALAGGLIRLGNLFNHEIMGTKTDGFGFRFLRNTGDLSSYQLGEATGLPSYSEDGGYIADNVEASYNMVAENTNGQFDFVWDSIPVRHPAQLYEAICYFLIFAVMLFVFRKKDGDKKTGLMFGMFMTLYFTARFIIEFWKEHQSEALDESSALTMGQYLSIPCVLIGLFFLFRALKKPNVEHPTG